MEKQSARKILAVGIAAALLAMSFALTVSMEAEALDFIDETSIQVPWTTSFTPLDSAWDANGTQCVVVGNETNGKDPSAWLYNEPSNSWHAILEGSDPEMKANKRVINDNTGIVYSTIQMAINNATAGQTIRLWAGTYNERIIVNKTVTITGNGSANTIIDANGTGIGVDIRADNSVLRKLTVRNAPIAGVRLYKVQSCTIMNNRILNNGDGIQLNGSSNNVIRDNDIEGNALGMNLKWSDPEKTLIGPVAFGGSFSGVMFETSIDGSEYDIIHHFKPGYVDGFNPYYTKPVTDGTYLYGTTSAGGASDLGTVYKTDLSGLDYAIIHDFDKIGGRMAYGPLVIDGSTLYGMTLYGGEHDYGVVFKLQTDGSGFSVLHEFEGGTFDGQFPYGGVTVVGGELWGMTRDGGARNNGTIFRMNLDGTGYSVVHHFDTDGRDPYGTLTEAGGILYGLTSSGGSAAYGTAFAIDSSNPAGLMWVYEFNSPTGPFRPRGSLLYYNNMLYGMTLDGGTSNYGTIFNMTTDGASINVLHSFGGGSGGQDPFGDLVTDGTYLYGMTEYGGSTSNYGTVFRILLGGSGYSVTKQFTSTDGHSPFGSLLLNGGNLYGMTHSGGVHGRGVTFEMSTDGSFYKLIHEFGPYERTEGYDPYCGISTDGNYIYGATAYGGTAGNGQVYRMNMDGTGYTSLHDFLGGTADGKNSWDAPLVVGTKLYGTAFGGLNNNGVIYSVNTDGTDYKVIGNFSSGTTGSSPYNGVITDGLGHLYGMTRYGGIGWGMIYQFNLSTNTFTWVHQFTGGSFGGGPWGELLLSGTTLYGMTYDQGDFSNGIVFKIQTDGSGFTPIHQFDSGYSGAWPYGSLIQDSTYLYGITNQGGRNGNTNGTIFKIRKNDETFTVIHDLVNLEGSRSRGSLTMDGDMLYAMTYEHGEHSSGTLIETNKNTGVTRVIHAFGSFVGDGTYPYYNDVIVNTYPAETSSGNEIFNNNFLSNAWQAEDNAGPNTWNLLSPTFGNYWDNYTAVDADGNGVWDSAFVISGNASSKDNSPLTSRDGWALPYTTFKSVVWDSVYKRFWIAGELSGNGQSSIYHIPASAPTTMVPLLAPYAFTALAVDTLGNVMIGGNDLQYIYYYETAKEVAWEIPENSTGAMYGWNITGITFNHNDSRFYLVGNVGGVDAGVAFFTDKLPLNQTAKRCYQDTSDFMNFPGIKGLKSISWNQARNYGLAVGGGVYRVNAYDGNTGKKLNWTTIAGYQDGKSYLDISWDAWDNPDREGNDAWDEAAIVGTNQSKGTYWRYYDSISHFKENYTNGTTAAFSTCAIKPPSSSQWLLILSDSGGWKVNVEQAYLGEITLSSSFPHIFSVSVWKKTDAMQPNLLNTQLDAGSTYTFCVEANYTTEDGIDKWNGTQINIMAWFDNFASGDGSAPGDWSDQNYRTRQFNLTYDANTDSASMTYPGGPTGINEFVIDSFHHDNSTYKTDGKHRLYINVTFGPQARAADGSGFANGAAAGGAIWDKNMALNDPGSWDMRIQLHHSGDNLYNITYEEFGIKEHVIISSTGNPSGSAPPGTENYTLDNPCVIRYSSNTDYYVSMSIPDLHLNGDELNTMKIPATNLEIWNNHSLAAGNSDISAWTPFQGAGIPLYAWGRQSPLVLLVPPIHGNESAGPGYSDYSAAASGESFRATAVIWRADFPTSISQGVYRAIITITIGN